MNTLHRGIAIAPVPTLGSAVLLALAPAVAAAPPAAASVQARSMSQEAEPIPGEVISFSAQRDDEGSRAANILDGRPDVGWMAGSRPPHTLVVELPGEYLISRLSFDNGEGSYRRSSVKEIRVDASAEDFDLGYEEVGTFTLRQGEPDQSFRLDEPVRARWLKLTIISNYGYIQTSLAEFRALGVPAPSGRTVGVKRPENVAAAEAGARLVSFTAQLNEEEDRAANVLDGRPDVGWIADGQPPQMLIVELPGEYLISRLSFDNGESSYKRSSAKEIRVDASVEGVDIGYEEIGTFTLEQGGLAQGFKLESPVRARWLKLTVLSNHGYLYTSLGEFRALGLPVPEQSRRTERGFQLTLPTEVLFDVDESALRPDAEQALAEVLAVLLEYPDATLLIEGHTDATGTPEHNQDLSEARAASVRDWLESQRGSATWRFEVAGHGETRPVASNDTPQGRQQNRRVEITIVTG